MDSRTEELTKAVISGHLGIRREEVDPTHHLRQDYGCDNLILVSMALDFEDLDELEVAEFPFEALQHVDTVSDLLDLVSRVARAPAPPAPRVTHAA